MNKYIGHELQLYGVREMRLVGGKGDGMRILSVANACGLRFEISLDRCGDISKLDFKGDNIGYFAPCGYVSPKYYDNCKNGFLKSFTAGFFTTCGLCNVGVACSDSGQELPLHGTVSNTPCESYCYYIENESIHIKLKIRDAALFFDKFIIEREYICPIWKNEIYMCDKIINIGSDTAPFEVLYHCNIGYPLLSETAKVDIPSVEVVPRNTHAAAGIKKCLIMEKPQKGYEEKCYYHKMSGDVCVSISNDNIKKGINIKYDTKELPCFTEWKMMGECEYVLGLEPGNCLPDGRDVMREKGILEFLDPRQSKTQRIKFEFTEDN